MPFPSVPTGIAGPAQTGFVPQSAATALAQRVAQTRTQQGSVGQNPIPEYTSDQTPEQYLQLLAASDYAMARTLAAEQGMDIDQLMRDASAAGYYEGDPVGGVLGRTVRAVGENIEPLTTAAFIAPFALGALGGAFGGAGAAGGTTAGSGTATITGAPISSAGVAAPGTFGQAAGLAGASAAPAAAGAANSIPSWVGNYLLPGLNAGLGLYGSNKAANAMSDASSAAIAEGARQFDTTRNDLMPWLDAGRGALNKLNDPLNSFQASPDYEFRRSEGMRDIGNTFASRGLGQSGNALRALTEYNSNLASGEFNNFWNRQAGLAGVGQNTAVNLGGLGANQAANAGNFLSNQGAARASGILGGYAAASGGLSDVYDNYLYQNNRSRRR